MNIKPLTPGQMPTRGTWEAVFYDGKIAPEITSCITANLTVALYDRATGRQRGFAEQRGTR